MTNEQMKQFERDMITAVNSHADEAAKQQSSDNKLNIQNNSAIKGIYDTVAKKSIKKSPTKASTFKNTNRTVNSAKIAIITCALVAAFGLSIITALGANVLLKDNIITIQETNRSTEALKTKALVKLLNHNLAGIESINKSIKVENNTINDYRVLNVSEPIDVYLYWKILPSGEFNKFIQSVTYTEPYSDNVRECIDFNQFLRIHGYVFKEGELYIPSEEVFENYMEAYIKNNYEKLLNGYEYGRKGTSYTLDDLTSEHEHTPTKKGGK